MLGKIMRHLRRDQSGMAAVEFGLWSVLFFMAVAVAMDFGSLFLTRAKLNEAVTAVAVSSFTTYDNVDFNNLPGYVQGLAGDASVAVSVSCNGVANSCTNLSRTCSCLTQTGTYVAATCGNTCSGGGVTANSTAGYYLSVRAQKTFQPIILPRGLLDDATIAQQAVVRLD